MRKLCILLFKLLLITFFFTQHFVVDGLLQLVNKENQQFLYQSIVNIGDSLTNKTKEVDIKKELLFAGYSEGAQTPTIQKVDFELPPYNNIESLPQNVTEKPQTDIKGDQSVGPYSNIKRVYIYSTHQMEEYMDKNTVKEASQYLAALLRKGGMEVDVEENDFVAYGRSIGLGYNDLYKVSRHFIQKKLESNKYDLIIDFHRDALPRELTYTTIDGKDYAKLMFVVGTISPNAEATYYRSTTLSDNINQTKLPIMKGVYKQYARYNQDLFQNMILLEVGSNKNKYQEVLNSLDILAKALLELKPR